MNYITKPKAIKKSDILNKEAIFSSFSYRYVNIKNENFLTLESRIDEKKFLIKNEKGFEPGSAEYIDFSENYFIRISEMNDLDYTFTVSPSTKKIIPPISGKNILKDGDLCFQTASNVGNVCFYRGPDAYFNSHIRKLEFSKDKYYIFGILKSEFGRSQVDIVGSIRGVDNFRLEYLLQTKIPFPTTKNNPNPENVEKLVSVLVQNLIHKEEQIKLKNKQIDKAIEKELHENQKSEKFTYSYPKISEIKKETRLDTGLYEREFKEIDFLIKNYKGGVSNFEDLELVVSRGQNLQISNIGLSLYSDTKTNNNFYSLLLSKNFGNRTIEGVSYLGTKKKLKTIKSGDIIFSCRGEMGRAYYAPEEMGKTITNIDNVHIRSELESFQKIFIFEFLGFLKKHQIIDNIACTGSGAASFTQYQFDKLLIPNFPELKQKEIAQLYYNKIEKSSDLDLDTYLEKEKSRNEKLGIFQLNMEIFELREKLENLVYKIVMEEKIEIIL